MIAARRGRIALDGTSTDPTIASDIEQVLACALADGGDARIQRYAATAKLLEGKVSGDPPANLVAWLARMTERRSVHEARAQYVYER